MSFQRSLLVCCDLKSYGSADDLLQRELQELLVRSLDRAGEAAGLDRTSWRRQAKGDEEWAVLPATTSEGDVVDRYVRALDAELAKTNRYRVPEAKLRMRMAIHFGTTVEGANGYPGQDAVLVSRLLNSEPPHAALEQAPGSDLVVVLSDTLFTSLVAARYTTLRPEDFRRVDVRVKDFRGHGWMWLPSGDVHSLVLDVAEPDATGVAEPAVVGPDAAGPVSPVVAPAPVHQSAVATGGSTVYQAGRDVRVTNEKADVIQHFDRNDQRGSHFGPVYRGDTDERA
jgi:class 3 adenylate cyclase